MKLTTLLAVAVPLGGCTTFDQFTPQGVVGLEPAATITAGGFHTCAVLENANRACWGSNSAGQLGVETPSLSTTPVFVPIGADLSEISAGGRHTCGIVDDGTPLCWGDNRGSQLGFDSGCAADFSCIGAPTIVSGIGDVIAIAAGGPRIDDPSNAAPRGFTCAVEPDLSVACWGASLSIPVSRTERLSSTPQTLFDGNDFPVRGIVSISAGERHACGVDESGGVWCWGDGSVARRRDELPPAAAIAAGSDHTCMAAKDGRVICWGENLNGQSGETDDFCSESCTVGPTEVAGISDAVAVTAGQRHSCALTGTGGVICWGSNQNGQLGVAIGGLSNPPRDVALTRPAELIDAGDAHTCALLGNGDILCWGADSDGQLGVGR
jgi:alpha-tubulin suppressor-like RCC1 family protein